MSVSTLRALPTPHRCEAISGAATQQPANAHARQTTQLRSAAGDAGSHPEKEHYPSWGLDITPSTGGRDHPDPARRMRFYLGVGHANHLNHSPVPLFISATTLDRYASRGEDFPVRAIGGGGWAGDSGAYSALMLTSRPHEHPWWRDPDLYGGMWVRLMEDIGWSPDFVAIQDWPCEPGSRRRTGLSTRVHQELTLASYLYLAEEFPMVPWLPVLQGWHPWEYVEHVAMYQRAGVELAGARVGIGSVCRQGSQKHVARVLGTLAPFGMRMHGFGVSINGLRLAGHLLDSSDSQAWSTTARREGIRLPGCTHMSRPDAAGRRVPTDCRNCFRYALHYREQVMDALRACARDRAAVSGDCEQLALDFTSPSDKPAMSQSYGGAA